MDKKNVTSFYSDFEGLHLINAKKMFESIFLFGSIFYYLLGPVWWYSRQLVRLNNMPIMGSIEPE